MTTEAQIQRASIARAKRLGAKVRRMHMGRGTGAGRLDVLFLFPGGRSCWIEFKCPGGRLTPLQKHEISDLQKVGQHVFVCDSIDSACQAFTQVLA